MFQINERESTRRRGSLLHSLILSSPGFFRLGLRVTRACIHCFDIRSLKQNPLSVDTPPFTYRSGRSAQRANVLRRSHAWIYVYPTAAGQQDGPFLLLWEGGDSLASEVMYWTKCPSRVVSRFIFLRYTSDVSRNNIRSLAIKSSTCRSGGHSETDVKAMLSLP